MMRDLTNGPRSLIVTVTERPFCLFSTRTRVPQGKVLCAADRADSSSSPPQATLEPLDRSYCEAIPASPFAAPVRAVIKDAIQMMMRIIVGLRRFVGEGGRLADDAGGHQPFYRMAGMSGAMRLLAPVRVATRLL